MNNEKDPIITVVIPSLNQGQFLDKALRSVFEQNLPLEVFVMDGGSTDNSVEIIQKWEHQLTGWRSYPDKGQAAAINEGITKGKAPFVCWLNSDDFFYSNGLKTLLSAMEKNPTTPAAYGKCWTVTPTDRKTSPYLTLPFIKSIFSNFCFIAQPATLIRRTAWEQVNGLDENLNLAFDYDLWWKLVDAFESLQYVKTFVAATRAHPNTKTANNTIQHYLESGQVLNKNIGRIPIKWRIGAPVMKFLRKVF